MSNRRGLFCFSLMIAGVFSTANAQDALVESAPADAPVAPFQFLSAGETIGLTATQTVEIGYLASCVRETITGGAIKIGKTQSDITGGDVRRETLSCGADVALSQAERNESGASAWRNDAPGDVALITNLAPVLVFSAPPALVKIERMDIPGRTIRLSNAGAVVDLAERGVRLAAGGVYAITAGGARRDVEVDFDAVESGGPAFLRAIRF